MRTPAFAELAGDDAAVWQGQVRSTGVQSSNTVLVLGDRLLLKAYRRLHAGINPELEIGRFLSETVSFAHAVPVAGAIEYLAGDGAVTTLALLQGFVDNQGDAWGYTLNYVEQFLEQHRDGVVPAGAPADIHGGYLALIRTLGKRTAELHAASGTADGQRGVRSGAHRAARPERVGATRARRRSGNARPSGAKARDAGSRDAAPGRATARRANRAS